MTKTFKLSNNLHRNNGLHEYVLFILKLFVSLEVILVGFANLRIISSHFH